MFTHPDLMWAQYKQHESDLIAEADSYRLLAAARRSRRARGSRDTASAVVRLRPARDLAAQAPHASPAC